MGRFRIYPEKSNTIASGFFTNFNSGFNPAALLWYGGSGSRNSISKHLIQFNLLELEEKINSKEINIDFISSIRLRMKNVIPDGKLLDYDFEIDRRENKVASSFDLIAFPINKPWDQGRGYDLLGQQYIKTSQGDTNLVGFSNFLSATSTELWDEPGVFIDPTTAVTYYSTQHFDKGDEDLDMDVTNIVMDWLSGGSSNNGLAISYTRDFETFDEDMRFLSRFFTEKTNTGFKPFLEVVYDNQIIRDERLEIANNRTSRLFLSLYSGNTSANYFSASTVTIKTSNNQILLSGLTPQHLQKGFYYVDVLLTGTTKGQRLKDVWEGVTFNQNFDKQDYENSLQCIGNYYNNNPKEINDYVVDLYGIDNNSILKKGEIIRLYAQTRTAYSTVDVNSYYGLEYRLIQNEITEVIPWSKFNTIVIENSVKHFIDVNTSWLLDNQNYKIEIRINELGTKRLIPEFVNFKIQN
jgi:hypothetical protein